MAKVDAELEFYRQLMKPPGTFENGFSLSSLVGVLFIGLIMVPGAIYMGLLAGQGIGGAAQWVTVILFMEIAKRANAKLSRAQLFVLFYMCGAVMSVGGGMIWNQFFVRSDAVLSFGMSNAFPTWVAPNDPAAYESRTFFQMAWLPAIGLMCFTWLFSRLDSMVIGYGLFRLTSDIEKLPFPMAPMGAQGMMALSDDMEGQDKSKGGWRWRVFAIGGALGLGFGVLFLGLPTITGALFGRTMSLLPIPWVETSSYTAKFLPAVATGLSMDLGNLIWGMIVPFFAALGSFIGLISTLILNPILYHTGVLSSWTPGDTTVEISFKNSIDFYYSFGLGISLSIAVAGIVSVIKSTRERRAELALAAAAGDGTERKSNEVPKGRGDIPNYFVLAVYFVSTCAYILVSGWLVHWHLGVMLVLIFFGFIYTPLISYVTARLVGIAGQSVEIPFIRELSLLLSGFQGVAVWFIPIPQANYGHQTVLYRQAELTGTTFTSLWKAEVVLFPILVLATLVFSSFIWGLAEVPSSVYPFAQQMWELNAKNACLLYSSTAGGYNQFQETISLPIIAIGLGVGSLVFGGLSWLSAPVTLCYGLVGGIGQTLPHFIIPQFCGALLGRYYFRRRFGKDQWGQMVLVLGAGFGCGGGLIAMLGIGIVFLSKASNSLPF